MSKIALSQRLAERRLRRLGEQYEQLVGPITVRDTETKEATGVDTVREAVMTKARWLPYGMLIGGGHLTVNCASFYFVDSKPRAACSLSYTRLGGVMITECADAPFGPYTRAFDSGQPSDRRILRRALSAVKKFETAVQHVY